MLIGRIDDIDGGKIFGWAFDKAHPDQRVAIRILWGENEVYRGKADKFRSDLHENGFGDGYCAFEVPLHEVSFNDAVVVIATDAEGNTLDLPKAQLEERHISRHFDNFAKEYKAVLIELARRLTALEARFERREREASEIDHLKGVKDDILAIEKRLLENDVYLTRIDSQLKKLSDHHIEKRPGLFSRLFVGK